MTSAGRQRQITSRSEAWLYVGALVHLVLLVAVGVLSISGRLWARHLSERDFDHYVRSYGWILGWLLTGSFVCVALFVTKSPNRRFRPVRALGEALLVIAGRLPALPPPPLPPQAPPTSSGTTTSTAPPPPPPASPEREPAIERPVEAWLYLGGLACVAAAWVAGVWLRSLVTGAVMVVVAITLVSRAMAVMRLRWLGSHASLDDRREFARSTRYGLRGGYVSQAIDALRVSRPHHRPRSGSPQA